MIMTKQEAAIVQAISMVDILHGPDKKYFYEYVQQLVGHPVPIGMYDQMSFRIQVSKLAQKDIMAKGVKIDD